MALEAILGGVVVAGDVVVIRYEGPKGGPGMREMLSPTGGLVGPGNAAFDAGESPVGYHGVVHDAAGYLKNFHDTGPGYDYLGREGRDTTSPLSGQREGIAYWRNTMGGTNPGSTFSEYLMRGVVGVSILAAAPWTRSRACSNSGRYGSRRAVRGGCLALVVDIGRNHGWR